MDQALFFPSFRQALFLAVMTFLAVGCASYLRLFVVEQSTVGIACQGGATDWLCTSHKTTIGLISRSVFGVAALVAALLNLLRPSIALCAIALIAAGFGMFLHNVGLSALAIALLVLSLARRSPRGRTPAG